MTLEILVAKLQGKKTQEPSQDKSRSLKLQNCEIALNAKLSRIAEREKAQIAHDFGLRQ